MSCDNEQRTMADAKQRAHDLIDQITPTQLTAVVNLLESILDPVARAIANAPLDDEAESQYESTKVRESKAWLQRSGEKSISHEEVLSGFGITTNHLKKSGEQQS
jgi:hypothetical protein